MWRAIFRALWPPEPPMFAGMDLAAERKAATAEVIQSLRVEGSDLDGAVCALFEGIDQ